MTKMSGWEKNVVLKYVGEPKAEEKLKDEDCW